MRFRQKGMTLLVGLVMLLLITLLAVSAIRMSTTGLQVVGNEQFHDESVAAANFVLDQVLTDQNFVTKYAVSGGTTLPSVSVGQASYKVVVPKITCKRTRTIPSSELVTKVGGVDTVLPADQPCIGGLSSGGVVIAGGTTGGTASGASLCSTVLWDVEAQVTADTTTGATADVHQGIEVRLDSSDVTNNCK
jgi:type II secretory pathway pseudopilin PulG